MLKKTSYPDKVRKIRIYKVSQGGLGAIKEYIHSEDTYLKAYVRQLSTSERNNLQGITNDANTLFVINYRENIKIDLFIEFNGKTYAIDGVDDLEFRQTEIKLTAYPIIPKEFAEIRWSE